MNENNDFPELELEDPRGYLDPWRCTACRGVGEPFGYLGSMLWYRCESCGWEWGTWDGEALDERDENQ